MPPGNVEALLAHATDDPSFLVRAEATRSLVAAPPAQAIPVLRRALSDRSPAVRACAGMSLTELRDEASVPQILRVLWQLVEAGDRERVRNEGERLRVAWELLGVVRGMYWPSSRDAPPYLCELLVAAREAGDEPDPRLAGFYAAQAAEWSDFTGPWGSRLERVDRASFQELALACAADPARTPAERAEALHGLRWSGSNLSPRSACRLESLLGDETAFGRDADLRLGDVAAVIILESIEGAGFLTCETPAERKNARSRAKQAVTLAWCLLEKEIAELARERSGEKYRGDTEALRYTPPAGDPERPWGIPPERIDAAVSARLHTLCPGPISLRDGTIVCQYGTGEQLAGDRLPVPMGASVFAYRGVPRDERGSMAVGDHPDGRAAIFSAGGSGVFFLRPVFRGPVTIECECAFDFIGDSKPGFLIRAREGNTTYGAAFGLKAVALPRKVADGEAPNTIFDMRPDLPAAFQAGAPVKLRLELRWPDGAAYGSLHVFFEDKEVSVFQGVADDCGRVGFSWQDCYFSIRRFSVKGKLDRAWAVQELCRQVFSIKPESLPTDELKGRVYGALIESLVKE